MSHAKERKEKNCLNCNAIVAGRFCQVCGQENIETHESFRHLATHFISDIFHFDGQFFSTSKYLLFRPGFLTYEYVRGRRASYLNPIKMLVFISAIFFLTYLSFFKTDVHITDEEGRPEYTAQQVKDLLVSDLSELDSLQKAGGVSTLLVSQLKKKKAEIREALITLEKDTTQKEAIYNRLEGVKFFGENPYDSKEQYDSVQQSLPKEKRDGWFKKRITLRNIELTNRFHKDKNEMIDGLVEGFQHHYPQMLFISLPLIALMLQLLYMRHKNLYYANHIIFTVHLFCATYVFLFIMILFNSLYASLHWSPFHWLSNLIVLYSFYYIFRAMKVFYAQGFIKTAVKWLLVNIASFVILLVLFVGLILFTLAIF